MDALWLGLIGVLGTLGGSAEAHHFDLRRRNSEVEVEDARRLVDLRRQTMAELADAMFGFRRVQLQNWYLMDSTRLDENHTEVASEMRGVRERAWAAYGRLALSWEHVAVLENAEDPLERVGK